MIFDRPVVESIEGLTAQSMPILIGQLFLFGRQTDRDARLELLGVTAAEIPQIKIILNEIAGQWLQNEEESETLTATSATNDLLQPQWRPPMQLKQQQFHAMLDEYRRDALLNRWPEMKLGALDGLSPNQAAADAKYKVKLLAAILILQYYADNLRCSFDLNELRTKLGLPILEPIDPQPGNINQLPLIRLARVSVDKLSDDDLVQAFQRAVGYNHRMAVVKFGREIIDRPSFASRRERSLAYITLARMDDDLDRALMYIEAGRKASDEPGKSNAIWDLEELSLRFARQEIPEALHLIKHIESTHINEANVSMVLTQILVEAGLLRPTALRQCRPQVSKRRWPCQALPKQNRANSGHPTANRPAAVENSGCRNKCYVIRRKKIKPSSHAPAWELDMNVQPVVRQFDYSSLRKENDDEREIACVFGSWIFGR